MNNIRFTTDLEQYLPDWYKEIADYQTILAAEEQEFETLKAQVLAVYGNLFASTMDASALSQWESLFGIVPAQTETLDFRRSRIINRISMKPPFTVRFLEQKLDELIGPGKYTLTVDSQNFLLTVETSASDQSYAIEVAYTINHTIPAHILYINKPVDYSPPVLVSETISKTVQDWQYVLGSWVLGFAPFSTGSNEEVIKVAATPSIQQNVLNSLATDFKEQVSKVRINGTLIISPVTTAQTASTFTVEYTLSDSQVTEVDQIELLDASNTVLTSTELYVPITQATTIKHVFPVKEGTNGN